MFILRRNLHDNDILSDDSESDDSNPASGDDNEEDEKVLKLFIKEELLKVSDPSMPVPSNKKTPPNAGYKPPQKNTGNVKAKVTPLECNFTPILAATSQSKGACLTLPNPEESQYGHQPMLDPKKRGRTKSRCRVSQAKKKRFVTGVSGYQSGAKQRLNTQSVQCFDVDMPPLPE